MSFLAFVETNLPGEASPVVARLANTLELVSPPNQTMFTGPLDLFSTAQSQKTSPINS